ncbi:FGGY-family carbohydrate kinase [Flaviflexus huanghaiensis]|uniref:FGGY-family carbohydrate kinase n=1 Tax=Flaviflexus huanghaiensis TaxID=1111473 RepID=UPI0015FAC82A|nr:FGGY-family carbohydrate kinase [Flaviflexus huanghaiensis]
MQYILGIDNGGTVTKAALHAMDGESVAMTSRSVHPIVHAPGWSERDMEDLWEANISVIREVVDKSKVDPADIAGVVLTGHGNGVYLVGANGAPVRNGIISNDSRAQDIVDRWNMDGSYREKCKPLTMQSLFSGGPLPILAWLAENEPDVVDKTRYIFMAKDFIRYRLTGNANFERTDASCTDLYDMVDHELHETVFEKMGAGDWEGKLPPLIDSTAIGGYILPEVAAATGLLETTPVVAGVSDISGAPVGVGGVSDYELSVIAGTWSINSYFSPEAAAHEQQFMTSMAPLPGRYLITEASPTSAANLEWFIQKVLRAVPGFADATNTELYEFCNDLAFSEGASDSEITYLPFLFGTSMHPHVAGSFTGITNADGLAQIIYSIYEGVALSHLEHIEKLRSYTNKLKPRARLTGGVTRSRRWTQLFADVIGMEIESVDVEESGILGAVIVGATGLGLYETVADAAAAMVPEPSPTQFKARADYSETYERWKRTVEEADKRVEERNA